MKRSNLVVIVIVVLSLAAALFFALRPHDPGDEIRRLDAALAEALAKRAELDEALRAKTFELEKAKTASSDLETRAVTAETALAVARKTPAGDLADAVRIDTLEKSLASARAARDASDRTLRTRVSELEKEVVGLRKASGLATPDSPLLADLQSQLAAREALLERANAALLLLAPPAPTPTSVASSDGSKPIGPYVYTGQIHPGTVAVIVNGQVVLVDSTGMFEAVISSAWENSPVFVEEIDRQGNVTYYSRERPKPVR